MKYCLSLKEKNNFTAYLNANPALKQSLMASDIDKKKLIQREKLISDPLSCAWIDKFEKIDSDGIPVKIFGMEKQ